MPVLLRLIIQLLAAAGKQVLISLVSERLLKDIIIKALEKLAKRTSNTVDDELVDVVKRALYPDFEAGQPPADNVAPK